MTPEEIRSIFPNASASFLKRMQEEYPAPAEQFMMMREREASRKRARLNPPPADAVDLEKDLHRMILDECKQRGWYAVHSAMNCPTTNGIGVCDFIIYANNGRVFNVEAKNRVGKLSVAQQAFIFWLNKLGHTVHVVRSFKEFLEVAK